MLPFGSNVSVVYFWVRKLKNPLLRAAGALARGGRPRGSLTSLFSCHTGGNKSSFRSWVRDASDGGIVPFRLLLASKIAVTAQSEHSKQGHSHTAPGALAICQLQLTQFAPPVALNSSMSTVRSAVSSPQRLPRAEICGQPVRSTQEAAAAGGWFAGLTHTDRSSSERRNDTWMARNSRTHSPLIYD